MIKKIIVAVVACIGIFTIAGTSAQAKENPVLGARVVVEQDVSKPKAKSVDYKAKIQKIQKQINSARKTVLAKRQKQYKLNKKYIKAIKEFKKSGNYGLTKREIATFNNKLKKLNVYNKRLKDSVANLEVIEKENLNLRNQANNRKIYIAKQNELKAIRKQTMILENINRLLTDLINLMFN